jgi:hypothetical protein
VQRVLHKVHLAFAQAFERPAQFSLEQAAFLARIQHLKHLKVWMIISVFIAKQKEQAVPCALHS